MNDLQCLNIFLQTHTCFIWLLFIIQTQKACSRHSNKSNVECKNPTDDFSRVLCKATPNNFLILFLSSKISTNILKEACQDINITFTYKYLFNLLSVARRLLTGKDVRRAVIFFVCFGKKNLITRNFRRILTRQLNVVDADCSVEQINCDWKF